ncbi:MAG: hypothetical protein KJ915_09215 [Candidatus Omnitrophica bacterium]|nr:hypothetical protein [Candidatus Omnitrophota bacterium]
MATEKQIEANKKNALMSKGAVTDAGKAIVAHNAVKHGVFAQDLIISSGDGRENEDEYIELLYNLTKSLNPSGQMEYLLVEKIAVDFWRLRRVLRFETGSIRKYLDMVIYDYYNKEDGLGNKKIKTNSELEEEIKEKQESLDWNNAYIKALKKGVVIFDNPTWENEVLESDIVDDLYDVIRVNKYSILQGEELTQFEEGEFEHDQLRSILKRAEYTDKDIADILIIEYQKQNEGYKKTIHDLEQKKQKNRIAEEVNIKICSLPSGDNAEKVMRYEKCIQKSIFQNLAILKKLQSLPDNAQDREDEVD